MKLIVQKYGGSCLATPEKVKAVAQQVAQLYHQGHSLIVVVSAMGKTTDHLVDLAYQVSSQPNRRELDMLLTTGERISMSLLSMALVDLGCSAISFTGSQAGVLTTHSHSNARIVNIKPIRLEEELAQHKIIVLAGFQGVDPIKKEITTLGRGGSDTTAVAMAAHFKAQSCEVLKEVDGICSADPHLFALSEMAHNHPTSKPQQPPTTPIKPYSQLDYLSVCEMCFWGAKILHYRSIELAYKLKVPLFVGRANQPTTGTLITDFHATSSSPEPQHTQEVPMFEQTEVLSVNSHSDVRHLKINTTDMGQALKILADHLQQNHLPWPIILASTTDQNHCRFMVTGDPENLKALFNSLQNSTLISDLGLSLASITLTCFGAVGSELPAQAVQQLTKLEIPVHKILQSSVSLTLFVPPSDREKAIQALTQTLIQP